MRMAGQFAELTDEQLAQEWCVSARTYAQRYALASACVANVRPWT